MNININIYSSWFYEVKSLIKVDYPIDIYVDNMNLINNGNHKVYIVTEPRAILPNHYIWIMKNWRLFNKIITYDENILQLPNAIKCLYGTTWVKPMTVLKTDNNRISFIIGNKNFTLGHNIRHSIYKDYLKINQKLDVFISTRCTTDNLYNNPFLKGDDKNNLFYEYSFHLCIENSRQQNYFTEKIMDCFQTMTVPIYWGAPNINEFFDINGIIVLDTDNSDCIIDFINSIDLVSFYRENIDSIQHNYETSIRYIDYNHRVIDIINT